MAKSASAMIPREKKQVLNASSSLAEASSEHLSGDESDEEFNRVECQPTDADHKRTSIEEMKFIKEGIQEGQERGTEIKCLCSTQEM